MRNYTFLNLDCVKELLIGAEGTRLLREDGAGETPQAQSAEEAPRAARGKRSAWSGNQHPILNKPNLRDFFSALLILRLCLRSLLIL